MNSHSLKLNGSFELISPLEIDLNYKVSLEGDVVSISKHTEDNGEYAFIYTLKPRTGEILGDGGKVVHFEKKSSQSQKLRSRIRMDALSENKDPDVEYERLMTLLRHYWPEIKENLESLESVL